MSGHPRGVAPPAPGSLPRPGRTGPARAPDTRRASAASDVCSWCSPALRRGYLGPLRRSAEPPEDLPLDGQPVAAVHRGPGLADLLLDGRDAPIDERLVLDVREVGKPQHRRRLHELLHQQADPPAPLDADLGAAGLEYRVRQLESDDAVDRGAKVEAQRLAARCALDLHLVAREAEAAGQRTVVELHHEVAATALVGGHGAGDVVAPVLVSSRCESARGHDAHAREAGLAVL